MRFNPATVTLGGVDGDQVTVDGVVIGTLTVLATGWSIALDADATPDRVETVLRAVEYRNTTDDPSGSRTVSYTLVDGDGTANGGDDSNTVTSTVTILAVNDEPAGADGTVTLVEDGTHVFAAGDFNFSDALDGNSLAGVVITTLPAVGTLYLDGIAVTAGEFITVADIDADLLTYQPVTNASGDDYATFTFQVRDDGGTANGGQNIDQTPNTITIDVTIGDVAPVAQDDALTTNEATAIVAGNLFADNGSGADTDPDGPPLSIAAVNGSALSVGAQITLDSGALLTVNADGTFDYNPNGAFDSVPDAASGASNTPGADSFTYTLTGGGTATVTLTIDGIDTDDTLLGTAGIDTLVAGVGNDTIDGLAGADSMTGDIGDDTYIVDDTGDAVIESAGGGTDTISASVTYNLIGLHVERLTLTGSADIDGRGNWMDNVLTGNSGANRLNGLTGADTMTGGAGNDTYYVDNAGDVVIEDIGGGYDWVSASVGYSLAGTDVERLTLTGVGAIDGTGNALDNMIWGNAGGNRLDGLAGADLMRGFGGDDSYVVDNFADVVLEAVGEGTDTVEASVSYHLGRQEVERLTLTGSDNINAAGNALDNVLTGNSGANTFNGLAGADAMSGGAGHDTYVVDNAGDVVVEAANAGIDKVKASVSHTLADNVERLVLIGTDAISGTGNARGNAITGNGAANTLRGEGGRDRLLGGGGDDDLYGGTGNDSLTGGAGADDFYFDTALNGTTNVDVLIDFSATDDSINLDIAVFTGLSGGFLAAGAFCQGTAAADADDRIIYDSATGNLFYDADGNGAGETVLFAQVTAGTALSEADFFAY